MIRRICSWLFGDERVSTRDVLIAHLSEMIATRDELIAALLLEAHTRDAQEPEPIVLVPQPEDDDEHRLKHYLMCGCELWPNCRHGDA